MTIYEIMDKDGRVCAFEIDNVGRQVLCDIVRSFPDINLLREPKFLSEMREEEFCDFDLQGQKFRVWEPFGDNSRYWIGPEPPGWCEQVATVRDLFKGHE